jgi:hypothetical protein
MRYTKLAYKICLGNIVVVNPSSLYARTDHGGRDGLAADANTEVET